MTLINLQPSAQDTFDIDDNGEIVLKRFNLVTQAGCRRSNQGSSQRVFRYQAAGNKQGGNE